MSSRAATTAATPTAATIEDFATLCCVAIDDKLELLTEPFQLAVLQSEGCDKIFAYLRIAAPSLRGDNVQKFSLHKPLSAIPSGQLTKLDDAQVNLSVCVDTSAKVGIEFPRQKGGKVDAIICIRCQDREVTPFNVEILRAASGPIPLITITLLRSDDIQTPANQFILEQNYIRPSSTPPAFIDNFNLALLKKRSTEDNPNSQHLSNVKSYLGEEYERYFTDTPEDTTHSAKSLELFHYDEIFSDLQITDPATYGAHKEAHVYSLLRRFLFVFSADAMQFHFGKAWSLPLTLTVGNPETHYKYTPRSDFSVVSKTQFPLLLLEVASDERRADERRMLLQAACLVRLGNTLLKSSSRKYFLKAIYIDTNYHAKEHTVFQMDGSEDGHIQMTEVQYSEEIFNLTNQREMFRFIFRLYNFFHSVKGLSEMFSNDLGPVMSSLASVVTKFSALKPKSRRDGSPSNSSNQSQPVGSGSSLRRRNMALATANGYTFCVENRHTQSNVVAKAVRDGRVFALKYLDSASDESKILKYLQNLKPNLNHIIQVLDLIPPSPSHSASNDNVGEIIVMPWLSSLGDVLKGSHDLTQPLQTQLLEGVWFLHKSGIAHLDLKPRNILVNDASKIPCLVIIDFGLSVYVQNEATMIEGYRGTPSWTAPEVGTKYGPRRKYSAVLADRWSCGKVLRYISEYHAVGGALMTGPRINHMYDQLLDPDPSKRLSLDKVLQLQSSPVRGAKRGNNATNGFRILPMLDRVNGQIQSMPRDEIAVV